MSPHKIKFLFVDHLDGLFSNPRQGHLTFTAPSPNQISLSLQSSDVNEIVHPFRHGLACKVPNSVNVSQSAHNFVSSLLAGQYKADTDSIIKLPYILSSAFPS